MGECTWMYVHMCTPTPPQKPENYLHTPENKLFAPIWQPPQNSPQAPFPERNSSNVYGDED